MSTDQQWDIVSGVGITALFVAAGRALETQRSDRLVNDPYADTLTRAVDSPVGLPRSEDDTDFEWRSMTDYLGVRSRFLDDWFATAVASGVRQAVILASGLDTRPTRLEWPADFAVFEIDQPKVLEYKQQVLANENAQCSCAHTMIPLDLREEWKSELTKTGFDPRVPTAWLAEGLLPYLPASAEQQLIDTVHRLAAPGSRIALDYLDIAAAISDQTRIREYSRQRGIDLAELISAERRTHPADTLMTRGWRVHDVSIDEAARGYGRELRGILWEITREGGILTAELV